MKRKYFYAESANVYPGIVTRNNTILEYEKFVQRTFFPYIIHPYSHFRVTFQKVIIIIIVIELYTLSIATPALPLEHWSNYFLRLMFSFVNYVDIVMSFLTGYIDSTTEIAILEPRKIIKRYLLTFFTVEMISSFPFEVVIKLSPICKEFTEECLVLLFLCPQFTYLQYFTFLKHLSQVSKIMMWNVYLTNLVSSTFGFMILLLFATNINSILTVSDNRIDFDYIAVDLPSEIFEIIINNLKHYVDAFLDLLLVALYVEKYFEDEKVLFRIDLLVFDFFANIIFMSYFMEYILTKLSTKEKFLDIESKVLTFEKTRHLSRTLEIKTLLYYQIISENKGYREDEIFDYIPDSFKADIFFHICLPLLKHYYAFENLPTFVLRRMAECMKYQLHLPNEVVMKKFETVLKMFFVHTGTVALYSSKHVELYHFGDGTSFNGRNFILGLSTTGSYAISVEVAEVYILHHDDFLDIMKHYPYLFEKIQKKIIYLT